MQTIDFLSTILVAEGNGQYCLFRVNRDDDNDIATRFFDTLQDLSEAALAIDSDIYSVYTTGFTFNQPARKQVNAELCQSFFLDIDCGDDKPYADKIEGFRALNDFRKALSLPKPLLVDSGNGLQAWWLLDRPIPKNEWQPTANQLKKQCIAHGFDVDPAVTADSARLLRVVGTYNRGRWGENLGKIIPCQVLGKEEAPRTDPDEFARLVNNGVMPVTTQVHLPTTLGANAVMDRLMGNKEYSFKRIVDRTIKGDGCAQLGHVLVMKGDVEEPLWRSALTITKFCTDGRKWAHRMSSGYDGYSADETDAKLENIPTPHLCTRFEELRPDGCDGCPHKGNIRTPIVLGAELALAVEEPEAEPVEALEGELQEEVKPPAKIPKFPNPYARGKYGGVYYNSKDSEGNITPTLIYDHDMYVTRRIYDRDNGETVVVRLHLPHDGIRDVSVPMSKLTSQDDLRKMLSEAGVSAMGKQWLGIMAYLLTWNKELQETGKSEMAHSQFGWTEDNKAFVHGDTIFTDKGTEPNTPSAATAAILPFFRRKGTLDGWKDAMSFFNRDGCIPHKAVVLASFGSVLVKLMHNNVYSAAMHLYSDDSGFGKTTALLAGASVWGDPEGLVNGFGDTVNARMNRAEIMKNYPMFMDELTNATGMELSRLYYQSSSGAQRNRMSANSNVERARGEKWRMLQVTTANDSAIDKMSAVKNAPKAEAQRVFEVEVHKAHNITKEENDAFVAKLNQNYGHAAYVFIPYVLANRDHVADALVKVQKKIDKAAGLDSQNRYWSVFASNAMLGGTIAKELGLIDWNLKEIFDWFVDVFQQAKGRIEDMSNSSDPSELISRFWDDHVSGRIILKSTDTLHNTMGNGLDQHVIPESSPRSSLVARLETDTRELSIRVDSLKAWCTDRHINYTSLRKHCLGTLGAKADKRRLAKGTYMEIGSVRCLVFNADMLGMEIPNGGA